MLGKTTAHNIGKNVRCGVNNAIATSAKDI